MIEIFINYKAILRMQVDGNFYNFKIQTAVDLFAHQNLVKLFHFIRN
jgi:hypothetical protein